MEKRRILIVDNNDELRALLEQNLGMLGHEVVVTGERERHWRAMIWTSLTWLSATSVRQKINGTTDRRSAAQTSGDSSTPHTATRNNQGL